MHDGRRMKLPAQPSVLRYAWARRVAGSTRLDEQLGAPTDPQRPVAAAATGHVGNNPLPLPPATTNASPVLAADSPLDQRMCLRPSSTRMSVASLTTTRWEVRSERCTMCPAAPTSGRHQYGTGTGTRPDCSGDAIGHRERRRKTGSRTAVASCVPRASLSVEPTLSPMTRSIAPLARQSLCRFAQ